MTTEPSRPTIGRILHVALDGLQQCNDGCNAAIVIEIENGDPVLRIFRKPKDGEDKTVFASETDWHWPKIV